MTRTIAEYWRDFPYCVTLVIPEDHYPDNLRPEAISTLLASWVDRKRFPSLRVRTYGFGNVQDLEAFTAQHLHRVHHA